MKNQHSVLKSILAIVSAAIIVLGSAIIGAELNSVVHAQFGPSVIPGFVAPNNSTANAAIGTSGTVTNPAANFVVQVQGGPVYCNGNQSTMATSTLTLPASSSRLVVYNCPQELMYAKGPVVGPGTASPDQPGVPSSLLFATPGVEIPLATVVCNATACGNGGNGSITDARTVGNFPAGTMVNSSTFANLPTVPDGTVIICTSCTQPAAGSTACAAGAAVVLAARVGGAWRCF